MNIYCGENILKLTSGTSADVEIFHALDRLQEGFDISLQADRRTLARCLCQRYIMVRAAGGIVSAPDRCKLVIVRQGRWDLPKGMVEHGETTAIAALREVREETGISAILTDKRPIAKTYHIYDKYGGWHIKQTTWYAMHVREKSATTPQTEEEIAAAVWASPTQCAAHRNDFFASLRDIALQ